MNDDLITKVESIKIILVSTATGGSADNDEYVKLRRELIATSLISKILPRFIKICRNLSEFWNFIKPKYSTYASRREYLREEFDPVLTLLETTNHIPCDDEISATVHTVSSEYIQDVWRKALERRSVDPEGAITSARSLLESVCKHILDEKGISYNDKDDLPKLYTLTATQLNLSPSQHTERLFKQILGGCQAVIEGVGALRNKHSDAHGKGKHSVRPAPRHAELAVNLSGAMAAFLFQTLQSKQK